MHQVDPTWANKGSKELTFGSEESFMIGTGFESALLLTLLTFDPIENSDWIAKEVIRRMAAAEVAAQKDDSEIAKASPSITTEEDYGDEGGGADGEGGFEMHGVSELSMINGTPTNSWIESESTLLATVRLASHGGYSPPWQLMPK
jgi:hypothetical protein